MTSPNQHNLHKLPKNGTKGTAESSSWFLSSWTSALWFVKRLQGFLLVYAMVVTTMNLSMLGTILRSSSSSSSCPDSSRSSFSSPPLHLDHVSPPSWTKTKTKTNQKRGTSKQSLSSSQQRQDPGTTATYRTNFTLSIPPGFISPACRPHFNTSLASDNNDNDEQEDTIATSSSQSRFKRIYITHMRKAGGTTLRKYFKKVATAHGLHFTSREAGPDEIPHVHRHDTFYVTHLRDPVARSLSHFQYEGRWTCPDLNLYQNPNFVPTANNSNSLDDWIRHEFQRSSTWTAGHFLTGHNCGHKLWLCSTNCYIKWINWKPRRCVDELDYPAYFVSRALTIYGRYNLIVDMEQLFTSREYAQRIEVLMGNVTGLVDSKATTVCDRPSKQANQDYPLVVSDEARRELQERNALDYQVYHALLDCPTTTTTLTRQRRRGWEEFPTQTLAEFV
jgi:hypothetical protein